MGFSFLFHWQLVEQRNSNIFQSFPFVFHFAVRQTALSLLLSLSPSVSLFLSLSFSFCLYLSPSLEETTHPATILKRLTNTSVPLNTCNFVFPFTPSLTLSISSSLYLELASMTLICFKMRSFAASVSSHRCIENVSSMYRAHVSSQPSMWFDRIVYVAFKKRNFNSTDRSG